MKYFDAIEQMKHLFPNKEIKHSFDDMCIRRMEIYYSDGEPHQEAKVFVNKIRFDIEGEGVRYIDIIPHAISSYTIDSAKNTSLKKCYLDENKRKDIALRMKVLEKNPNAGLEGEIKHLLNGMLEKSNRTLENVIQQCEAYCAKIKEEEIQTFMQEMKVNPPKIKMGKK